MKPIIYFYIPVFNEQDTVGVILYRLSEVMKKIRLDYEVFLTLDGCTDDSAEVVEPYMKRMPLRVTQKQRRVGYGKSLYDTVSKVAAKSGNPKRDFFLVLDADFTCDPGILDQMEAQIERNADIIFPDRSGKWIKSVPLVRKIAYRLAGPILRFRGIKVKENSDLLASFRGCRVQLLRRSMIRLKALAEMGPKISPAACMVIFSIALLNVARNLVTVDPDGRKLRRRTGRFGFFNLLWFVLFNKELPKAAAEIEQQPPRPRRHRRYSNKKRGHSSKNQTSGKRNPAV